MPAQSLTTDHPAWQSLPDGGPARVSRLVRSESGCWVASWGAAGLRLELVQGTGDVPPAVGEAGIADLPPGIPPQLAAELGELGAVRRLANPWLWDAITTAILRQVVRAAQARVLYRRWCLTHGPALGDVPGGLALPPDPEAVLALPDHAFADIGAAFHRTALQAAAEAYLDRARDWVRLKPADLVEALDEVPRIGPWTARAAAADHTGDFSVYPHGDLAVRTWAKRAAPDTEWPDKDRVFDALWCSLASTPGQLHALTLLTLAWGSHVSIGPEHQCDRNP